MSGVVWQSETLVCPQTGNLLIRDTAHSLSNGSGRYPIIREIPYLRLGKEQLRREALRLLDNGDEQGALVLLLGDRDDWAKGEAASEQDLIQLVTNKELTLREAMRLLNYGAVADYFAYRWSDPTYLSGLQLLETHLPETAGNVLELACGIGHYLREFGQRGINATGVDVVFSKLYLARRFVAPEAQLICADANYKLPFPDDAFDAAFCHDAFYFLPNKAGIVQELNRIAGEQKTIVVGHAHNAEVDNYSSGAPLKIDEYAAFFDNPTLYDDAELTRAFVEEREPRTGTIESLRTSAALSFVEDKQADEKNKQRPTFLMPLPNRGLSVNPLLEQEDFVVSSAPLYPSERYENEYAALSGYLNLCEELISFGDQETAFYGHWEENERLRKLVRRRVFLDLPEDW